MSSFVRSARRILSLAMSMIRWKRRLIPRRSPRLLIMGTPCDPFSSQRPKWFHCGSVKDHGHYRTTFGSAYEMLQVLELVLAVMEQVAGFDKPYSTDEDFTPKQRPGPLMGNRCGISRLNQQINLDILMNMIESSAMLCLHVFCF